MRIFYLLGLALSLLPTCVTAQTLQDCNAGSALDFDAAADAIAQDTPFVVDQTYTYCIQAEVNPFSNGDPVAEIIITTDGPALPATITVTDVDDPNNSSVLDESGDTYTIEDGSTLFIEVDAVSIGAAEIVFRPLGFLAALVPPDTIAARVIADRSLPVVWSQKLRVTDRKEDRLFTWAVASQHNVAAYELQRKTHGEFVTVASVPPRLTVGPQTYTATDEHLRQDAVYRILQHDFDGAVSASNTVLVPAYRTDGRLMAYPNPATTRVRFSGSVALHQLTLYDAMGRRMTTAQAAGAGRAELDVRDVPSGIYTAVAITRSGAWLTTRVRVR